MPIMKRLIPFLISTAIWAQPFVDMPTQVKRFDHDHTTTAGNMGGQLGIQALLDSIKSGGSTATKVATVNTSLTAGFCLEADANGNVKTAASGAACGTEPSYPVTSVFGRTGAIVAATDDYAFTQINGTNAVNKGGTGATTLTGILQGNGTDPFTANAASNMLTYLRRQANTTTVAYNFSALDDLVAGDYYWSQQPGGTLSIGANSVTLTPGPLGVVYTKPNTYVYITGGSGTPEAALLTGGTCDGTGQSSCTIIFTAANNHSGAFTVGTATSGIKEALNVLPSNGGRIRLPAASSPYNLYATLYIGDGDASAPSTINDVSLIGDGGGATNSEVNPATAGTLLQWAGPASGTLLDIEGPFAGANLSGLYFECDGTNRGATGLLANHPFNSNFKNLIFNGCSDYAIKLYAYGQPTNLATGANNNIWEQIQVYAGLSNTTAGGLQIGAGSFTLGDFVNVAQNVFTKVNVGAGSAGTALDLRLTDSLTFTHFTTTSGNLGILITDVDVGGFHFPTAITCIMCSFNGSTTPIDDSSYLGTGIGGWFWPYNNDQDTLPDPVGTNGWSAGVSNFGRHWGAWKNTPEIYAAITSSTAIANTSTETEFSKTFDIPAGLLRVGTRVRVTASGKYSTTGTPTMQLAMKIGGNPFSVFPATATPNNASDYGWSFTGEFVTRATGASGTVQNGHGMGGLGGVTPAMTAWVNNFTLDTTIAETITVTADWSASSMSNTITMDTLSVEVLDAGSNN